MENNKSGLDESRSAGHDFLCEQGKIDSGDKCRIRAVPFGAVRGI